MKIVSTKVLKATAPNGQPVRWRAWRSAASTFWPVQVPMTKIFNFANWSLAATSFSRLCVNGTHWRKPAHLDTSLERVTGELAEQLHRRPPSAAAAGHMKSRADASADPVDDPIVDRSTAPDRASRQQRGALAAGVRSEKP